MYKRHWTAPTIGRSRRGPPWPLGRLKRPVPNIRGGGPVSSGLTDSSGGNAGDPNSQQNLYANYGIPGQQPTMQQDLQRQVLQQQMQQQPPLPQLSLQQGLDQQEMRQQMLQQAQQPQPMACGGVVNKPTVAVVGERGPEAVVKLRPRMSYQRKKE